MRISAKFITHAYRCAAAALLACAGFNTAHAETFDRVAIRVGGFVTRFDTVIRADEESGERGSEIDFNEELGLQEHDIIEFVGFEWRPWDRHEFGLNYFEETLAGTRQLRRDIVFRDVDFAVNATVHTRFDVDAFEFHYTWWPLMRERWALGVRFGYMDYRVLAEMNLLLGEQGETPDVRVSARVVEYIPAPSFGIDVRVTPAPDWRITANAGWFEASFKTVSPDIITMRVGTEYLAWENVGLWADFGVNRMHADVHSSSFDGALKIQEGGLRLGVTWRM
ncbi:MAG TPA: hypothetical protein VF267_01675 [Gammaproteobacteria bacterium]